MTHGGNLRAVALHYGVDEKTLIDFSANLNVAGPPSSVVDALQSMLSAPELLRAYPDPDATLLRRDLAVMHGISDDAVVVGAGASALLDVAIRATQAEHCIIAVPCFSEYRRSAQAAGMAIEAIPYAHDFTLQKERMIHAIQRSIESVVVIANPANPSGLGLSRTTVLDILRVCESRRTHLIVDEAFIDFIPGSSVLDVAATHPYLSVVRSLTKCYGMAGIRIGYAVALPERVESMRKCALSWPVGTLESLAGRAALGDDAFKSAFVMMTDVNRASLARGLREFGFIIYDSQANFLLCEVPGSDEALNRLLRNLVIEHGIVVRDCRNFEGIEDRRLIRVAVRSSEENDCLIQALTRCFA